jgi:hypothetical protein
MVVGRISNRQEDPQQGRGSHQFYFHLFSATTNIFYLGLSCFHMVLEL